MPADSDNGVTTAVDVATLRDRWPHVLDSVREVRKTAWILLSNYATIESVEGNVVTLAFDAEGNAKGFASSGSDGDLAEVLGSMFGARLTIRTIVRPGAVRGGSAAAAAAAAAAGPAPGGGAAAMRRDGGSSSSPGGSARSAGGGSAGGGSAGGGPAGAGGPVEPDRGSPGQPLKPGETREESGPQGAAAAAGGMDGDVDQGGPRDSTRRRDERDGAGPAASRRRVTPKQASGPRARPSAADLSFADAPEPMDMAQAGVADEVTGSDLIMRELGGRVIEEVGEV